MLKTLDLRGVAEIPEIPRATVDTDAARIQVREMISQVREGGDAAAADLQAKFGARPKRLVAVPADMRAALDALDPDLRGALEQAASRIRAYHEKQFSFEAKGSWRMGEPGATVGERVLALDAAGCYVPGGRASYPSSVLMTAIPARVAGVREVTVCTPPTDTGEINPTTLAACALAGVDRAIALGGVQAIAAMAFGTQSVPRSEVIVGPGNMWVTLAKMEVAHMVRVDGFQGPTEILIIADSAMPPAFSAADLVAQAEHDPQATCVLVTTEADSVEAVQSEVRSEVAAHPRSADVEKALTEHGLIVIVEDLDQACHVAEAFAPEHLELAVGQPERLIPKVPSAGAVFCGPYSPVSLGDYVAGTNHVLPTAGSARFTSPLRVGTFLRASGIISFGMGGLQRVSPALVAIAEAEGLVAHARAVQVRTDGDR